MTDLSATETNTSTTGAAAVLPHSGAAASVRDYFGLLKPRVMTLVVFTGFVGLWVAPGHIHPFIGAVAVLCIAVGAGASGAINMWYDRDIDAVMKRTKGRALPSGVIDPSEALALGATLTLFSVLLMALAVNYTAAALLAIASAFYVFVYTAWLKRRTAQNIVIGGAAGAFPPMIGWAAVTGNVSIESILLFTLIFIWTPPHFWALALFANHDYERAGVPMLPVVAGEAETKKQMLFYTLVLFPLSLAPYFLGMAGLSYLVGAAVMSGLFVISALRVMKEPTGQYKAAKRMFGYSVFYLFALFALMMI